LLVAGAVPGLVFVFRKISAKNYLEGLQQKIQAYASQVDNYLVQRGEILKNVARIIERAESHDKDVHIPVAQIRSGGNFTDEERNEVAANLDAAWQGIQVAVEAYPDLQTQPIYLEAMRQNSYLQKEITAARDLYNDAVLRWNQDIFIWPAKRIVAARNKWHTRIPFYASAVEKEQGRAVYF